MDSPQEYYFDLTLLQYRFASNNGIDVDFVYTEVGAANSNRNRYTGSNKVLKRLSRLDSKFRHISLVDIVVEMVNQEKPLKEIRDRVKKYKNVDIFKIGAIYEENKPGLINLNPRLRSGIQFPYTRTELKKKYKQMQAEIETYPQIIKSGTRLIEQVLSINPEVTTTKIEFSSNHTKLKFNSSMTSEQFFELNQDKRDILFINYNEQYWIRSDFKPAEIKNYFNALPEIGISLILQTPNNPIKIDIDWENKEMSYKGTIGKEKIVEKLEGIRDLEEIGKQNFIGHFDILTKHQKSQIQYKEQMMAFLVTVDPIINQLLYIDEKEEPGESHQAKNVYHLNSLGYYNDLDRYRSFRSNMSAVRYSIHSIKQTSGDRRSIKSILRVSFNNARTEKAAYLLKYFIPGVISRYIHKLNTIKLFYNKNQFTDVTRIRKVVRGSAATRIQKLSEVFEEVYGSRPKRYSTRCEARRQPKVVSQDKYEGLNTQSGSTLVLEQPRSKKKYYLYCDNPVYNQVKYQHDNYPCCFKPGGKKKIRPENENIVKAGDSKAVPIILSIWFDIIEPGNYARIGSNIFGPESFYSVIVNVLGIYKGFTPVKAKNKLKRAILKELKENRNFSYQENTGYSPEDLEEILKSSKNIKGVVPSYFYSIIEQMYNISIFVIEENREQYQFEMYPQRPYYVRNEPIPGQKTCLILKYNNPKAIHYELIINSTGSKLHSNNFAAGLYSAWSYQYRTINLVNYYRANLVPKYDNIIHDATYLYQVADIYDKIRLIEFRHAGTNFSLYTKPMNYQKVFGPIIDIEDYYRTKLNYNYNKVKFDLPDYYKVINYFSFLPVAIATAAAPANNIIIGLWYNYHNIADAFYCPVNPVRISVVASHIPKEIVKRVKAPPFAIVETMSVLERTQFLQTINHNILTVVSYLFTISGLSPAQFFKYIRVNHNIKNIRDTREIYSNLADCKNKLVVGEKEVSEKKLKIQLENMSVDLSPLISKYGIQCYSTNMKIGLEHYIVNYNKNLNINKQNLRYKNFKRSAKIVIDTPVKLETWKYSDERYQVRNEIKTSQFFNNPEPIIYRDGKNFYLVQNVYQDDLRRAINVALIWYQQGVNKGHFTNKYLNIVDGINNIPQTTLVPLNPNGRIQFSSINVIKNSLLILRTIQQQYAAILPLKKL